VGVSRSVHEVDSTPPSYTEVKNEWSYTSVPPFYSFVSWLGTLHVSFLSYRPFLINILNMFVNKVIGRFYVLHLQDAVNKALNSA
jgi:hypothetical protein